MSAPRLDEELRSLARGETLLLPLVFSAQSRASLLRHPPSAAGLAQRLDHLKACLHEADRDGGDQFPLKLVRAARGALESALKGLPSEPSALRDAAVAQMRGPLEDELRGEIRRHIAPGEAALYASDLLKIDAAAERLGFDPDEVRAVAEGLGLSLYDTEARPWVPLASLPGAPVTLSGVAEAMLSHPLDAANAIRAKAVSRWLLANGNVELGTMVGEAEREAERDGAVDLARHRVAWTMGLRDLAMDPWRFKDPAQLRKKALQKTRRVGRDELRQWCRAGVLGRWFERHDEPLLAAKAREVTRRPTDALPMEQLLWALGLPLTLDGEGFDDAASLARRIKASKKLCAAAQEAWQKGVIEAWLESLDAERGDGVWLDALRDQRFARQGPFAAFWFGVYRHAKGAAFSWRRGGVALEFSDVESFRDLDAVAQVWDALKPLRMSGELVGWMMNLDDCPLRLSAPAEEDPLAPRASMTPRVLMPVIEAGASSALPPIAPEDNPDLALNRLLWCLDVSGVVVEWGRRDRVVEAPEELCELYVEDPAGFDEEARKGYLIEWLSRRSSSAVAHALAAFTTEVIAGRAPKGHLGLAVALLAGLRRLPVEPRSPGLSTDATDIVDPASWPALSWHPYRAVVDSGVALLWLALHGDARHLPLAQHLMGELRAGCWDTDATLWSLSQHAGVPWAEEFPATTAPRASMVPPVSAPPPPPPSAAGYEYDEASFEAPLHSPPSPYVQEYGASYGTLDWGTYAAPAPTPSAPQQSSVPQQSWVPQQSSVPQQSWAPNAAYAWSPPAAGAPQKPPMSIAMKIVWAVSIFIVVACCLSVLAQ